MNLSPRRLLFLPFFLSGFCGLVYQVVWTRTAFAAFEITFVPVLLKSYNDVAVSGDRPYNEYFLIRRLIFRVFHFP